VSTPADDHGEPGASRSGSRRRLGVLAVLALPLALAGCQLPTFYGYKGSTTQGHDEFLLYAGTFIAAIVVGVITAALILWAIFRYRHKSDEIPRQFQYHTLFEVTYTIVPVVIVLVLFGFTVVAENKIDAVSPPTVQTINVYAFQWGWEFNYSGKDVTVEGETVNDPDPVGVNGGTCAPAVDCLGPGLVVPAGEAVLINLRSKDTIHGFYVPQFNFSRYAQPGILNQFQLSVKKTGIYRAQCTQFCGLYHSQMFFHVVAMTPNNFQAWLVSEESSSASNSSGSSGSYGTASGTGSGSSVSYTSPSTEAAR